MFIILVKKWNALLKSANGLEVYNKLVSTNQNFKFFLTFIFVLVALAGSATNYYVSTSGNDSNNGTSENTAWKSIAKVNSVSFKPGDRILFHCGDTFTGTINVNNSGTSGSAIVYGSYGTGLKPVINGAEVISGWTQHSGNIYKAKFSSDITQIFVDGKRVKTARYPNTGYFLISNVGGSTKFTSSSLSSSINYTGAKWMGRTNEWYSPLMDVVSSSGQSLTLNASPSGSLGVNEGFVLMNKLEFLDEAGEWYYDSPSNTIYLWTPNSDNPSNHTITGSVYETGFAVNNSDYITIENLEISNFQSKGIGFTSSDNYAINGNEIKYCEEFAIHNAGGNSRATVTNNIIDGINGIGIYIWGGGTKISDNVISNIGLFDQLGLKGTSTANGGSGMEISGTNNTIEYNKVINTNYNGIFYRYDPVVQYNFIQNACLVKDDGGGIYTGGKYSGSIVRYNIVDGVSGNWTATGYAYARSFGEGIYIDEPQESVKVYGNTVISCGDAGIYLHDNSNTEVNNNTIFGGRYAITVNREHSTGNSVHDNIFYVFDTDDYEPNQMLVKRNSSSSVFNNNMYINHYNNAKVFRNVSSYYSFNDWKSSTGQDSKSTADFSALASGETEKIFYNNTKQTKTINLGTSGYRDIYGTSVSGSITLEPFTSRILIKTDSKTTVTNQSPVINDQNFDIQDAKKANDIIGQVVASDPDAGQILQYSIIQGNSADLFAINSSNGEIYAKSGYSGQCRSNN